jgi:hypothetical protein
MIRHGARTPYTVLPEGAQDNAVWICNLTGLSLPNINEDSYVASPRLYRQRYINDEEVLPGNCSQGQLTEVGYWMHRNLGAGWKAWYIDTLQFLDPELDTEEVYVRSTDIPRTIKSAESNLLGMFPPSSTHSRHGGAPISSIVDIFTLEAATETLYLILLDLSVRLTR